MKMMNSVDDDNESTLENRRLASKYRKNYKSSSAKYKRSRVYKRDDEDSVETGIFIGEDKYFIPRSFCE